MNLLAWLYVAADDKPVGGVPTVHDRTAALSELAAGPFGGTRVIQSLLPVMRELGLVTIFWDVNFSSVQNVFDEAGVLKDQAVPRRIDKFLKELIWMTRVALGPRERGAGVVRQEVTTMAVMRMICPECGVEMNFHAEKLDPMAALKDPEAMDPNLSGSVSEIHSCPQCGNSATRRSSS
ncbi:MAG: hypothetical protein WD733_06915 [Bryobacterales bacterium]